MLSINSRSNSCYLDLDFKYSLQPCAISLYHTASINYSILSYRILYEKRLTLNKRNPRSPDFQLLICKETSCTQNRCRTSGWKYLAVTDFLFLGSRITVDGDCSHEIRRQLLLGRKAMTNLDSILRSKDITLPTNVHLVKAVVFPVAMYRHESWTIKKTEHQKIDAFKL